MLLETLVQEAVDERIQARVAVANQLEEGHDDAECLRRVEEQIDGAGEEGEPTEGEQRHDGHQHLDDAFLLPHASLVVHGILQRVADRSPHPEAMRDTTVRHEHDDDGQQVEEHVEDESVDDHQSVVGEVLHADLHHAQGRVWSPGRPQLQLGLDALDEELRDEDGEGHGPEEADDDHGTCHGVHVPRLQRVADGVIPATHVSTLSVR